MPDQRLNKLAKLIVNYSTDIKAKDRVYIQAEAACIPFITEVAKEAIKKGAYVEYGVKLPDIEEFLCKNGNEDQLLKPSDISKKVMSEWDVLITAWGTYNTRSMTNVDADIIQKRRLGSKEIFNIYMNRSATGELKWCGTQFPTYANAQEAEMSLSEYEDFVYGAGLLDSEHPVEKWKQIAKDQEKWVEYLDTKKELHFISKDTDIKVNVEGRKWINCCGKENFPDGEIFTSPVENKINGHITFSFPAVFNGKLVENIKFEVKDGKVVKASASKGEDLLISMLDTDEGSRFFGEVAIGTNYGIKKFTKNILFDEKIGGTIHMAIGNGMKECGSKNESAIHWDMICDMRNGGKIYADGVLFYENGTFIDNVLKN